MAIAKVDNAIGHSLLSCMVGLQMRCGNTFHTSIIVGFSRSDTTIDIKAEPNNVILVAAANGCLLL